MYIYDYIMMNYKNSDNPLGTAKKSETDLNINDESWTE